VSLPDWVRTVLEYGKYLVVVLIGIRLAVREARRHRRDRERRARA